MNEVLRYKSKHMFFKKKIHGWTKGFRMYAKAVTKDKTIDEKLMKTLNYDKQN